LAGFEVSLELFDALSELEVFAVSVEVVDDELSDELDSELDAFCSRWRFFVP
jgi:hypothetical protein